jgi:uncharacterized protein YcbX
VYAPDVSSVTLTVPGDRRNIPAMTFSFPGGKDGAAEWFSMYFEQAIQIRYARDGFPDDGLAAGPTIVSTASLQAVCEWFPGITLEEARRRFRATLEIGAAGSSDAEQSDRSTIVSSLARGAAKSSGDNAASSIERLPAFWEDQLFAESETSVMRFRIGEVAFEGSNPCARCPVPARDSRTGADRPGFQKRFSELRRAQLPSWAPAERFDHFYRLATNTRVPSTECRKLLRLGDPLIFDTAQPGRVIQ